MDLFDRAQALELAEREAILARAANRPQRASLSHCEDCGEDIPLARQQASLGCTRCIDCQINYEKWGGHA